MNAPARHGAFAASDDGARWTYAGAMTFENAEAVLEGTTALPLPSTRIVDLGGLDHADSAAIAVLIALRRRAYAEGTDLSYATVPAAIVALARVYGVDALVGV
jgi:phospholipid transport system transporter-binding protein